MITIKKILVPTDFSDIPVPAIGYAISLAMQHAAEVTVLHALPHKAMQEHFTQGYVTEELIAPMGAGAGARQQSDLDSIFETKKRLIYDFLRQKIGPELLKGVKINPLIRFGKALQEVVATAKEEKSDLIVMASHGSRFTHLFHESLTERIMRRAPCPVLSIQPSAEVRTEEDERVPVKLMDKWAA